MIDPLSEHDWRSRWPSDSESNDVRSWDEAEAFDLASRPTGKLLPLLDLAAWEGQDAPSREWALRDWIPARQATYLTGPGSAGKSLLSQQLCTCIALGLPFMGLETRQAVAIYVTCEDDPDELHRRQKTICEALGVRLGELVGKLHLVSLVGAIGNELATFDGSGRMLPADAYRVLKETVQATEAGFVALDNVAHLFGGNENIRHEVAAFCGLLNQLAADAHAAVLFIGHPNKAGDSFSGSTAWENQVRSRLFMETPRDAEGFAADPDARVLSRGKANYARNGESLAFRWHQWAFVRQQDLPGGMGEEIAANAAAAADNEIFLRCLRERIKQRRAVSEKSGANYAPKVFESMPESRRIGKARLTAAVDRLYRLDRIERGFLWRDTDEGRDIVGLRETSANASANDPQTRSANDRTPFPQPPENIHPIPKGISGAASGGPAPSDHGGA